MKAILKKMDLIVNLKGFALTLLGVGVLVSSQGAWGQDSEKEPSKKAMEESIQVGKNKNANADKLTNELRPVSLPNGLEAPRSNKSSGSTEALTDFGRNMHKNVNIVLPPLKGFRQLADAAPIQEMYKELINKKVPVLVQTMMMVENGAATGFIGSMNMVSNLMNNTIQTQQFQLELMNLTDDKGQMKYAYAGKIQKAFEVDKVTSWPAALYVANGDSATAKTDGPTKGEITEIPKSDPFKAADDINMRTPEPTAAKKAGKKESFVRDRLMPKLYDASGGSGSNPDVTYKNDKIKELQDEFIEKVGDFEIDVEDTGGGGIARVINGISIKPKEGDNKQWGVSLEAQKETLKVWENLNELMYQLCKFKKDNKNNGLEPTKKITASTSAGWTPEMWKDASSPDIVITQNILEQIFLVSRQSKDLSELECDQEFPPGKGLGVPFGGEFAPIQDGDPDICKKGDNDVTSCLRFRALYHMASIIGQSRALHTYEIMRGISERFAKDPATQELNHRLFVELLGEEGEIGIFIDKNRDRWAEFTLYMARYMQGQQGSGGTFKPGGSNAVGISPGADRQGK